MHLTSSFSTLLAAVLLTTTHAATLPIRPSQVEAALPCSTEDVQNCFAALLTMKGPSAFQMDSCRLTSPSDIWAAQPSVQESCIKQLVSMGSDTPTACLPCLTPSPKSTLTPNPIDLNNVDFSSKDPLTSAVGEATGALGGITGGENPMGVLNGVTGGSPLPGIAPRASPLDPVTGVVGEPVAAETYD
ncbi:hypothetical protein M422DRAFT_66716 [Sphaerobolus stellatus SS14]|uniref:Uncharacterized protein n=1 Tax=Sphaerobolus stellatus (strain SS14) TaxID=990650 RepID=A0A0C9W4V0_SPHS4|nr:hypothetical protein M422DRAFT_66716 [Sphaerobolus stellatus SS14]